MILCFVVLLLVGAEAGPYCFSDETNPYLFFGTSTNYHVAKGSRDLKKVPNCRAEFVWVLSRHGTTTPDLSHDVINELYRLRESIINNYKERSSSMCDDDINELKKWNASPSYGPNDLTKDGEESALVLGRTYASALPDIFENNLTKSRLSFGSSSKQKSIDTAENFIEGVQRFGSHIRIKNLGILDMLEPAENCSAWHESMSGLGNEAEKFAKSTLMKEIIQEVSLRLGFKYNLTFDTIRQAYDMCGYMKAMNYSDISPWCTTLTPNAILNLEYYYDLKTYWETGFGNKLSYKLGCPLAKDALEKLENYTKHPSGPTAVTYFTDSVTLRVLLTRLGLAKDVSPPRADNKNESVTRQWRMSFLSPYLSNLAIIMYRCNKTDIYDDEFKISFFLNGHLILYKGCNVGLCDWSYIYSRFQPVLDSASCNLNFCNHPVSKASKELGGFIVLLSFVIALALDN